MIGSFWNLCRACPSMPVDKLHSEYRSTYRWHEYRGGAAKAAAGSDPTAAHPPTAPTTQGGVEAALGAPPPVVRRAPLPSQATNGPRDFSAAPPIEPAMPRRKKYPGLAYKTNEIFDGPAAGLPSGGTREGGGGPYTLDRARSMERTKYLASRGERRSKSEGPRNALPNGPRNWTDTVEEKAVSPSIAEKMCVSSEYRNQFAWPRDGADTEGAGAQPRKSASMGALKAAQQARKRPGEGGPTELEPLMNHTDDDDDRKKYIENYTRDGDVAPRRSTFRSAIASFRRGGAQAAAAAAQQKEQTKAKGYKSEYKKKFRPFSYYVFEASKGTFTKRRAAKGEDAAATDGGAGGTRGAGPPEPDATAEREVNALKAAGLQSLGMKNADSWYREVLDLRKRAGEYKYRGWGTELAPDHLTELYNKQMELWYQVSRRSSLSALSLASTNHRVLGKEDKDLESKSRTSPSKKPKSFRSAPHQSIHAKLQEAKVQQETAAQRAQRRKLQGHSFDNTSVSEGKTGRSSARTSPRKQLNLVIGARGGSVEPAPSEHRPPYRSPKRRPRSADPKPISNGPVEEKRRPSKPSGLALNASKKFAPAIPGSGGSAANERRPNHSSSLTASPKRKSNRARVGITIDDDAIPLRSGSAFRDHRGTLLDDSPVVKSPPEPTRVKSPEQMNMRSPDPVNWTVPLDTGKTFTVTQNVKSDDLMKRPGSDFRGGWGGDEPHSASFSAPLEATESLNRSLQEMPSVHQSPSTSKADVAPPKSVEISQRPTVTNFKHAKTPTSPPNLTPIDETKVLDVSKPIVNGGGSSGSETHPSPVASESRLPGAPEAPGKPTSPVDAFKPTEATQKSHGVDTTIVAAASQASIAAEVLEKARTRFDQFWGKKDGNDSV